MSVRARERSEQSDKRRARRVPTTSAPRRDARAAKQMARVGCHFLVQLWRMVQDRDHTRFTRVTV
jgi:hypothetical protein